MIKKHSVFPTLILEEKKFLSKEECRSLCSSLDASQLKDHGALEGNSKSSHAVNYSILDQTPFDKLRESIKNKCRIFATENSFYFKNIITESWFNIQKPGSILKEHTHPNALISGVLFLEVDKDSSPIYFHNPNPYVYYTKQLNKNNDYSREVISFHAEIGDLILFPAWLKHGSNFKENKSPKRTILSFNIV